MSQAISVSFQAWEEARIANDFKLFEPHLEALVALKIKETELLGYEENPYDALLDEFEPGLTVKDLDVLFAGVREELVDFVKTIGESTQVDDSFMYQNFPHKAQWDFGVDLLKQMGYDNVGVYVPKT